MGWTLAVTRVAQARHYLKWKVVCTSDGSALSATDLVALAHTAKINSLQGSSLMAMKVSPGTGGVIPDTTINVTLTDEEDDAVFTMTGASKDAISWHDLSTDIGMYPTVFDKLSLAINDIGASGDQVTLYFICWIEDK